MIVILHAELLYLLQFICIGFDLLSKLDALFHNSELTIKIIIICRRVRLDFIKLLLDVQANINVIK